MADIIHEFTVKAPPERVFQAFATPKGLDSWWTKASSGETRQGGSIRLYFGPEFDWQAKVTRNEPPHAFELQITKAHPDWAGTVVGCELDPEGESATRVKFHHVGRTRTNIGGFPVSAGQCTCESCVGMLNTEKLSNTRGASKCNGAVETDPVHSDPAR